MSARQTTLALLAIVACLPTMAWGQNALVADFEPGPTNFSSFFSRPAGDVVGFRFTAENDITLSHLGLLIDPADGVMDADHEVGLWDEAGTLLAQVTVPPSGLVRGDFVYAAIEPLLLVSGSRYTLGAMYFENDLDSYNSVPASMSLVGITDTIAVRPTDPELGFVYPGVETSGNRARLGPNALFGVPEPGTLTMGLGVGLLVACRRLRRRAAGLG